MLWTTSPISSKSPSVRRKGITPIDLSNFLFLRYPLEVLFFLFLTMKGDPNSAPPSSSTLFSSSPCECSGSNSLMSIVTCDVDFSRMLLFPWSSLQQLISPSQQLFSSAQPFLERQLSEPPYSFLLSWFMLLTLQHSCWYLR